MKLYRPEVFQNRSRRLAGEVIIVMPRSMRLLVIAVVTTSMLAIAVLAAMPVARHESVTGWLSPAGGLVYIRADSGGIVSDIMTGEGQKASAGEPLFTLRLSRSISEDGDVGFAVSAAIEAQDAASSARLVAARERLLAEKESIKARMEVLNSQIAEMSSMVAVQEASLSEAKQNLRRTQHNLSVGLETQLALQSAQALVRAAEESIHQTRSGILAVRSQSMELGSRVISIDAELASADADAAAARGALAERQVEVRARSAYQAVAPIDGRVLSMNVGPGQAVIPGATLAVLAPEGALQAELFVPSRAAGFIRPGQAVKLQYQAFPYQKFGAATGTVVSVSRTVLAPSDVPLEGPEFKEPVFRVRASVPAESILIRDQEYPLQPGMLLTADVILEERTLLEWALSPLYGNET